MMIGAWPRCPLSWGTALRHRFAMVIYLNHLAIDMRFPYTYSSVLARVCNQSVSRCGHVNSTWIVQIKSIHTKHNSEPSKVPALFKSSIAITMSRAGGITLPSAGGITLPIAGGITLASAGITVPRAGLKFPSVGVTFPSAGLTLVNPGLTLPSAVIELWPMLKSWWLN